MMTRTLMYSVAIAAMLCVPAYAQQASPPAASPEKTAPTVAPPDIDPELGKAGTKTEALSIFLEKTLTKCSNNQSTLKAKEEEYNAAVAKATDDAARKQLTLDYLKTREELLGVMIEDFDFVSKTMEEEIGELNSIVGELGKKGALLQQAEKAAADTKESVQSLQKLSLAARRLSSQKPAPGSPDYMTWFRESKALSRDFEKSKAQLKTRIRQAIIYEALSKVAQRAGSETAYWQEYIADQTIRFEAAKEQLAGEQDISKAYIKLAETVDKFDNIKAFADFAGKMKGIVDGVTSSTPPPPVAGGIRIPDLPDDAKTVSLADIESFDAAEYERKLKEDLSKKMEPPTAATQPSEKPAGN